MVDQRIVVTEEFVQAIEAIQSSQHVFITGKAGTGKSTLLRMFREQLDEPLIVLAPTGVAAINVEGMTIHRFFGFRPDTTIEDVSGEDYFPRNASLMRNTRRLVIDEVSMVRADLMDCIEVALRRFGPDPGRPFGGVQLVMFGDLYQLPPVSEHGEVAYLRDNYKSDKFFGARCFEHADFVVVELTEVFRQRDDDFIAILNAIRDGSVSQEHLDVLNARYDEAFEPDDNDFFVTLATINKRVDAINTARLQQVPGPARIFTAQVDPGFPDYSYPAEVELALKVDAQVMLLNNDSLGRWANGTLGRVQDIPEDAEQDGIGVRLQDTGRVVRIHPHMWQTREAVYVDGRLRFVDTGGFRQFPIRLAWAFTIHKSQGKTLDHVIIDLYRGVFSEGQLYVALSRCTSLEGIVLKTRVKHTHVQVDRGITAFLKRKLLPTHTGDNTRNAHEVKRWAFLGAVRTSHGMGDRFIELAAIILDDDGQLHEYETLIHPAIDVGDPREHGITADMISAAPQFTQAWTFLREQLQGCIIATYDLMNFQGTLEQELISCGFRDDLGIGLCARDMVPSPSAGPPAGSTALEQARWVKDTVLTDLGNYPVEPFELSDATSARTPRLLVRDPTTRHTNLGLARHPASSDATYALLLAANAASPLAPSLQPPERGHLTPERVAELDQLYLDSLTVAVTQDQYLSAREVQIVANVAALLQCQMPGGLEADDAVTDTHLVPGTRVCFTGSATNAQGEPIEREELERIAETVGLIPVPSLTKSRTDLLVTADRSSMSGKAKNARRWQKPVISVQEFLDAVASIDA